MLVPRFIQDREQSAHLAQRLSYANAFSRRIQFQRVILTSHICKLTLQFTTFHDFRRAVLACGCAENGNERGRNGQAEKVQLRIDCKKEAEGMAK